MWFLLLHLNLEDSLSSGDSFLYQASGNDDSSTSIILVLYHVTTCSNDTEAVIFQELVLRDNKLMKIPDVGIFKKLLVFDVSFNDITSLHGLCKVSNTLKELYVSKNQVSKIEEIDHFYDLLILELGCNRLRVSSLHS